MKSRFKHVLALFGSRYNHLFHRGIAAYARETRWHLSVSVHTGGKPVRGIGPVDGVLLADDFPLHVLKPLVDRGTPGVSLVIQGDNSPYSQIVGDNVTIGRLAGEHFRERGYKHYAWSGPGSSLWSAMRMEGFRKSVAEVAVTFEHIRTRVALGRISPDWAQEQRTLPAQLSSLGAQLSALPRPCAVFCANDPLACRVLDACLELDIRVPEEIAILGVDDDPLYCESVAIPLSSVRHDAQSVGFHAAEQLERLMESGQRVTRMIAPLGIAVRHSTDHRAVENPAVLAALRFIDENHARNIGVQDVAAASGTTLRALQGFFRDELHESMVERITAVRLEKAQELLSRSSVPVAEIAARVGFASSAYFHRVFKHYRHCTPVAFRNASQVNSEKRLAAG